MNFAHLHLVLNHIPVIGIPIAVVFLAYGLYTNNRSMHQFSLIVLSAIALVILPVYLTGEPAEEAVEHLPGVMNRLIEDHEEAAEFAMVITLLTGGLAFLTFWFRNQASKLPIMSFIVLAFSTISMGCLVYTANLGGKIRHSEIRSNVEATPGEPMNLYQESEEVTDD